MKNPIGIITAPKTRVKLIGALSPDDLEAEINSAIENIQSENPNAIIRDVRVTDISNGMIMMATIIYDDHM